MDRTTALMDFLGKPIMVAAVDYVIDNYALQFTRDDMMEGTKMSYASSVKCVKKLEQYGFLLKQRSGTSRRSPHLYNVNKESPIFQSLMGLDLALTRERERLGLLKPL